MKTLAHVALALASVGVSKPPGSYSPVVTGAGHPRGRGGVGIREGFWLFVYMCISPFEARIGPLSKALIYCCD